MQEKELAEFALLIGLNGLSMVDEMSAADFVSSLSYPANEQI